MECEKNGGYSAASERGVKRQRNGDGGGARELRLALPRGLPGAPRGRPMRLRLGPIAPRAPPQANTPFMNTMDEISYWVFTKRAPCLFNYDNLIKKQSEEAHCSKPKPKSVHSTTEEVPSPKKKKRKLKLLDDDSASLEKHQNVYFETSQQQTHRTAPSVCKSDSRGSNVDFNIKSPLVPNKSKRMRMQRNNRSVLLKKNNLVTSTPKVTNLRRSARKAQQSINNNSQLDSSFEIFNNSAMNGNLKPEIQDRDIRKSSDKQMREESLERRKNNTVEKPKNEIALNGHFEDLSDVSGFTANYIRSTKIHSTKTPRKIRGKTSRNLMKESKQVEQYEEEKIIMCVNKSVNTGQPNETALNCSTDSSQNIINLVTMKSTEKSAKVNKSTSLLKFIDTTKSKESLGNGKRDTGKKNLNVSFQSQTSTPRYPTRHRNNCSDMKNNAINLNDKTSPDRRKRVSIKSSQANLVDTKETADTLVVSRTRSGRKICHQKKECDDSASSIVQVVNSSELVSSNAAVNVASPIESSARKKRHPIKCVRPVKKSLVKTEQSRDSVSGKSEQRRLEGSLCSPVRQSTRCSGLVRKNLDKRQSSKRESLRDKSGFAMCFSDSDEDSEPLKQRRFFC